MSYKCGCESPERRGRLSGDESLLLSHYFVMHALVKSKGPLLEHGLNGLFPEMLQLNSIHLFMDIKEEQRGKITLSCSAVAE